MKYHLCFLICAGFALAACDTIPRSAAPQIPKAVAPEKPAEEDNVPIDAEKKDKPAPVLIEPQTLVGLTAIALKNKLGKADYIRMDGDFEIYQYRLNHCIVDFIGVKEGQPAVIKFWHGQHRKQGGAYDHKLCQQSLGARQSGN